MPEFRVPAPFVYAVEERYVESFKHHGVQMLRPWLAIGVFLLSTMLVHVSPVCAARFCSIDSKTIREEMVDAARVVVANSLGASSETEKQAFEVVRIIKGNAQMMRPQVIRAHWKPPKKGQPFLVMGFGTSDLVWQVIVPSSPRLVEYVQQIEALPKHPLERLEFFVRRLDDRNETIAGDALQEVSDAPYNHLAQLGSAMDCDQLLARAADPETKSLHRALCFKMLGICGNDEVAAKLEETIRLVQGKPKYNSALSEAFASLLILRGADGVQVIEEMCLAEGAEFPILYSGIQALRAHVTRHTLIPRERILQALRLVLDRPEVADLVIPDLARLEDWTVIDRIQALCLKPHQSDNWVRVPAINYLRQCPLDKAKAYIEQIKQIDPKAVERSFQFFPDVE